MVEHALCVVGIRRLFGVDGHVRGPRPAALERRLGHAVRPCRRWRQNTSGFESGGRDELLFRCDQLDAVRRSHRSNRAGTCRGCRTITSDGDETGARSGGTSRAVRAHPADRGWRRPRRAAPFSTSKSSTHGPCVQTEHIPSGVLRGIAVAAPDREDTTGSGARDLPHDVVDPARGDHTGARLGAVRPHPVSSSSVAASWSGSPMDGHGEHHRPDRAEREQGPVRQQQLLRCPTPTLPSAAQLTEDRQYGHDRELEPRRIAHPIGYLERPQAVSEHGDARHERVRTGGTRASTSRATSDVGRVVTQLEQFRVTLAPSSGEPAPATIRNHGEIDTDRDTTGDRP